MDSIPIRSALYYPHTEMRSRTLLTISLLLWDRLEFISPFQGFRPNYTDSHYREAVELIGHLHVPTDSEKGQAHGMITELGKTELPEAFFYHYAPNDLKIVRPAEYDMGPEKLLPETWRFLQDRRMAERRVREYDWRLPEIAGFTLMSVLADCCAGTTKARVTDHSLSYAAISNIVNSGPRDNSRDYTMVVPLTFHSISANKVSLPAAIKLRTREEKSHTSDYRAMRHKFLDAVTAHIEALGTLQGRDRFELNRQFEQSMEDDLRDLKEELGLLRQESLLTREVITLIVAGAGLAAAPSYLQAPNVLALGGLPVAVGGIWNARNKYVRARKALMKNHPMAYLYYM